MHLTLSIDRMTYGSDAVARTPEGKTVFVEGGVAGDVVSAEITEEGKRFDRAKIIEVLEPSPDRVESRCPYAGLCGGCPWAHVDYAAQLRFKRANVIDALVRLGHMDAGKAECLVRECVAPGDPWGYRNKIELGVKRVSGKLEIGMYREKSEHLVRVDACLLQEPRYAKTLKAVRGAVSYLTGSQDLGIERIGIRASKRTKDVEVAFWTEPGPWPRAQVARVMQDAVKATSVVRVMTKGPKKARKVAGVEAIAGAGSWSERIGDETMRLSAPSFFQVNTRGAEKLVELVLAGLEPREGDVAMDLYSGAGTFTLPLARTASFVDAVEAYGPAVRDLRRNLEIANIDWVDVVGGDAGREFPDDDADIIVVDPPRAGLAEDVVKQLSAQPARSVAYVSCDPATLARDLERFAEIGTFEPVKITPVDLFPQTYHVETATILKRIDPER